MLFFFVFSLLFCLSSNISQLCLGRDQVASYDTSLNITAEFLWEKTIRNPIIRFETSFPRFSNRVL